ncbi:MAG TPA: hypothetical protein VGG25_26505 [Streptosporangiaceae bacterium]
MRRADTSDPAIRAGLAAVSAAAGGADPMALASRAALALLTPGTFASRRARQALDLLAGAGFRPAYARLVTFDDDEVIGRMWAAAYAVMEPDRRVVCYDLLRAAESLLLVLRYTGPGGDRSDGELTGASERLAGLKGHSDPARCGPEALRTRLGSANRVINMLHCAATTPDTVREAALLLDAGDLAAAWRSVAAGRDTVPLGGAIDIGSRWCGNSLAHVGVAVRSRLLDALAAQSGAEPAGAARCRREWQWLRERDPGEPRALLAEYRAAFPACPGPGGDGQGPEGNGKVPGSEAAREHALGLVEGLLRGRPADVGELRATLARAGCAVDRWEWVVLASYAVTPVPPEAAC